MTFMSDLRRRIVFVETERTTGWPSIRIVVYTRKRPKDHAASAPMIAR